MILHKIKERFYFKIGRIIFFFLFLCFIYTYVCGQEQIDEQEQTVEIKQEQTDDSTQEQTNVTIQQQAPVIKKEIVPLKMVFHNLGWNILNSITCNYGLNFIGAGLTSWIAIESGLDWYWDRLAYNNQIMPRIGNVFNYIGYAVPVLTPLVFYLTGRLTNDTKLQLTAMALTQSIMLTLLIQVPLKVITGRTWPGITDGWDSPNSKWSNRTDDFSKEFNWFSLDGIGGWPSGHAAHAFSAAATIAQIYHDNLWVKIGVYTYASLLSFGMSMYDHWASDIFAGVFIGLAIGTSVGRSYRNLIEKREEKIILYATPNSFGVRIRV